jgi:transposase
MAIDKEKGYYLFPLAMTGKVPEELTSVVSNPPAEVLEIILNDTSGDKEEPAIVGRGFVVEKNLEYGEGDDKHSWPERWLIVQSYAHGERQRKGLIGRLEKAEKNLESLTPKKGESLVEFQGRVEKVLRKYSVEECIHVDVKENISPVKQYKKRGRPGPNSPYEIVEIRQLELEFHRNESVIEEQFSLAGWRVYVTNTAKERMSLQQSVRYYRDEWRVEGGMHRFKRGSLPALPLFLRISERIKGLMLLLTVALQVLTLMEFVIRRELAKRGEMLGGLVPGNPKIKTARPTAERVLSQFKELNCQIEEKGGRVVGRMVEKLTPLQEHILTLLKLPTDIYDLSFNRPAFREAA